MNTKDEAIHTIESQATVLDRDNRPLSSGQVRLYTKLHSGVFWPQDEVGAATLPKNAARLKTSDGSVFSLKSFEVCQHVHIGEVNHCEFEYDLTSGTP